LSKCLEQEEESGEPCDINLRSNSAELTSDARQCQSWSSS
jgi:hypothetical protein